MTSENKGNLLGAFFDEGSYTCLYGTEQAAVIAAFGMVGAQPVYAICQTGKPLNTGDIGVMVKTMGLAAKTGNPVATFYNAPGTIIEQGLASLQATAQLNAAIAQISGVVPQIAVITGVCGASQAMAAANADVCIMAHQAKLFLSAPFLSAAGGDKVQNAGSVESAVKAGVASVVAQDVNDAVAQAAKITALLPSNNLSAAASFAYELPTATFNTPKYSAQQAVEAIADQGSAVELFNGYGCSVVTALATVNGTVTGLVATAGADTTLGTCCVTSIARFVRLCDAFSIPVVTVINTGGFTVSTTSDEAGTIRGAARLAATYADATTAKVAVLAGKAVGSAYAALSDADITIAVDGAVIAPVEPSAAVSVLYKDEIEAGAGSLEAETASRTAQYIKECASANAALQAGLADMVVQPAQLRGQVAAALDILVSKRTQRIAKKHGNTAL